MSDAFEKVVFRGKLMDRKTMAFLQAMEEKLGYELTVVQGCYNPGGVAQSGGTHDGGGVIDLAAYDWRNKVRVAADLGAFAYHRPYIQGLWGEHIHFGIRNHGRLSPAAQAQQRDWDAKPPRNGLAGHAPLDLDRYYHPGKPITFDYPVRKAPVAPKTTRITQARSELVHAIHDIGEAAALIETADSKRPANFKDEIADLKRLHKALRGVLHELPKK